VLSAAEKEVAWKKVRLRNARRMKTLIAEMSRPGYVGVYLCDDDSVVWGRIAHGARIPWIRGTHSLMRVAIAIGALTLPGNLSVENIHILSNAIVVQHI